MGRAHAGRDHGETPGPQAQQTGLCLDKSYDVDEVRDIVRACDSKAHIGPRGEEAIAVRQEAGFKARRWVAERTRSRMNRFRRVLVCREKRPITFIAMLHLAGGIIIGRTTSLLE